MKEKLKKKIINDDKNSSKIEENNYIINKEKKLIQNCYFDYQETIQTAAKKTVMKKA